MTKNSILKIFAVLFFTVGLFSCEKENEVATSETKTIKVSKDVALKELTLVVAKSLENSDFRTLLKNEAMKQFDGDYDVLFSTLKTKEVSKGNSVLQYLVSNCETKGADENYILNLASQIKDFQISVPVNCDKWETKNYSPLVTYIPEKFDETTLKEITCLDANGKEFVLSLEKEPELPVIVLGSCERIDNIQSSLISETIKDNLNSKSARYSGGSEYLSKIKFSNLGYYETWAQGKPEIELRILSYTLGGILTFWTTNPSRNDVDEKWKTYNTFLTAWHFSSYGDYLTWYWQEKDSGDTYTYTATNNGQTVSFTSTDESDNLSINTIHKADTRTEYSGGNFQYTIYWN